MLIGPIPFVGDFEDLIGLAVFGDADEFGGGFETVSFALADDTFLAPFSSHAVAGFVPDGEPLDEYGEFDACALALPAVA